MKLREPTLHDADALVRMVSHPDFDPNEFRRKSRVAPREVEAFINMAISVGADGPSGAYVISENEDRILGLAVLACDEQSIEAVLGVDVAARGQGVARAALAELEANARRSGFAKLELIIDPTNVVMSDLTRKCGCTSRGSRRGMYLGEAHLNDAYQLFPRDSINGCQPSRNGA